MYPNEKDHPGDWSPVKDLLATDVLTTCVEAIFRVESKDGFLTGC